MSYTKNLELKKSKNFEINWTWRTWRENGEFEGKMMKMFIICRFDVQKRLLNTVVHKKI